MMCTCNPLVLEMGLRMPVAGCRCLVCPALLSTGGVLMAVDPPSPVATPPEWQRGCPLTGDGELLHSTALPTAAVGGQGESFDAAASPDTAAEHVVGVQIVSTL